MVKRRGGPCGRPQSPTQEVNSTGCTSPYHFGREAKGEAYTVTASTDMGRAPTS